MTSSQPVPPASDALAPGDLLDLDITGQAAGGETIARPGGRAVFVRGAIPGERVRARVTEVKKRLARADVEEVLEASTYRVPDRRLALGAAGIGGMEFAHVDLAHSRVLKAQAATDQFTRLGGLAHAPEVLPAAHEAAGEAAGGGATVGLDWRTRVQLAVARDGRVGMRAARSHEVLPVDHIPFAVPTIEALGLHHLSLPGVERLEIAAATGAGGTHGSGAVLLHGTPTAEARAAVTDVLTSASRGGAGAWDLLVRTGGAAARNRGGRGARKQRLEAVRGNGYLTEHVPGLDRTFRVRADGFWQVHRDAAGELAARVVAETTGARKVLDLYCGVGLFSLAVGDAHGIPVVGIEGSSEAIDSARRNATAQRSSAGGVPAVDAEFEVARIEQLDVLPAADTIVLDPPRAGAGEAVCALMGASAAERIVYVSCDGGTFARDAALLRGHGFDLVSTEGHDYFPLTAHTEFVSVFAR